MGKPTFGQLRNFSEQVESGRITGEMFQGFLENPGAFRPMIPVTMWQSMTVMVDNDEPLSIAIERGGFVWWEHEITGEHFPTTETGRQQVMVELIHLKKAVTIDQALKAMNELGYVPATVRQLLAVAEVDREHRWEFPVVALGSVWVQSGGCWCVPYLSRFDFGRSLYLHLSAYSPQFDENYRFLAIRKPAMKAA